MLPANSFGLSLFGPLLALALELLAGLGLRPLEVLQALVLCLSAVAVELLLHFDFVEVVVHTGSHDVVVCESVLVVVGQLLHGVDEVVLRRGHCDHNFIAVVVAAEGRPGRLPVAAAATATTSAALLTSSAELAVVVGSLLVEVVAVLDLAVLVALLVAESAASAPAEGSLLSVGELSAGEGLVLVVSAGPVLSVGGLLDLERVPVAGGSGVSSCSFFHLQSV